MKPLQNHIIIYDAECPICTVFSKAVTKSNMLDSDGRASYQDMPQESCVLVDRQRAVNEIALVNTQTGEVNYGIESLFKLFGYQMPVLKPLFNFGPFIWIMRKVYAFVSYNRRVIVPPANTSAAALQPTFRLRYRLAYLLFTWLLVGYILTGYAHLLTGLVPLGNSYREYLICGGQILFQGIIVSLYAPAKRWDYLGNMMTISFAGALLLLPVMLLAKFLALNAVICTVCFMGVAGLMLLEHIRRTHILKLGWLLTVTWVTYRLLVLLLIFKFD